VGTKMGTVFWSESELPNRRPTVGTSYEKSPLAAFVTVSSFQLVSE